MRKTVIVSILLALLLCPLVTTGCAEKKDTSKYTESERQLEGMYKECQQIELIDGGVEKGPIKVNELKGLGEITVDTVLKRSNGMHMQGTWTGTPLSKVLEHYGIATPFAELKVEAWDGYVGRFPYETSMLPDTILARLENGKKIDKEDGPTRFVVASQDGYYWVKMIVKIEVIR